MASFGQPRPAPSKAWPTGFKHGTSDGYEWFLRLGPTNATRQYTKDVVFWNEMLDHPSYDDLARKYYFAMWFPWLPVEPDPPYPSEPLFPPETK